MTRLKQIMIQRQITHAWLAKQTHIPLPALSLIVIGSHPSLRHAQRITHVLGMEINELWPFEDF